MTQDINTIKNFFDLVSCYGIEIPLIQRDYVQGRVHETAELLERKDDLAKILLKKYTDEREKRDKFVERLVRALLNPNEYAMQLTFLYGTKEVTSGVQSHQTESFIPLDGQQRLTTLFLLSWTLLHKLTPCDRDTLKENVSFSRFEKGLHSLSYKTRPSSRDFCANLFKEPLVSVEHSDIQDLIKKQTWFRDDWAKDPTVSAILQMLVQFDVELSKYQPKEYLTMINNLVEGKGISFDILDMKNYQLTDGLYIKMNARGKQLTKFENWKSEFIGFLEEKHKGIVYENASPEICHVFGNRKPTLREYFEYSIEHQWTDLFWTYCVEQIEEHEKQLADNPNPSKRDKDCYPVIDEFFMNFFTSAHQILYFLEHNSKEPKEFQDTIAQREETFGKECNVKNLFDWLDILKSFNDDDIYSKLFFTESGNQYSHPGKVRLFDGNQLNLLTRCAKADNYTNIVQIIHYGMLRYAQKYGHNNIVTDEFKSYIRQIRNILENNCSVRNKDVNIVNTLQIVDIYGINSKIENLLGEVKEKKLRLFTAEQAEIDDFDFIYGNFATPLFSTCNTASLITYRDVLKNWDALDEYDKIRLFVAYGYQGMSTMPCAHGQTFLFGNNSRWKPIFMRDKQLELVLNDIYADYQGMVMGGTVGMDALKELLTKKTSSIPMCSFAYYFLQYKSFVFAHAKGKTPCMYFSIKGNREELDICAVAYSNKPTLPYHTDPVIFATKEELYKRNTQKQKLYVSYSVQGPERACLLVYSTSSWDENPPIACFYHLSGLQGAGGWEYTDSNNNKTTYSDNSSEDRIQAGAKLIRSIFPDNDFAEKG